MIHIEHDVVFNIKSYLTKCPLIISIENIEICIHKDKMIKELKETTQYKWRNFILNHQKIINYVENKRKYYGVKFTNYPYFIIKKSLQQLMKSTKIKNSIDEIVVRAIDVNERTIGCIKLGTIMFVLLLIHNEPRAIARAYKL